MSRPATRRLLLKAAGAAALAPVGQPACAVTPPRTFAPKPGDWKAFEVVTTVTVTDVQGAVQVWLPIADIAAPWQQPIDHAWTGNGRAASVVADPRSGVRMLRAEFAEGTIAPTVTLASRVRTRDRATDWSKPDTPAEDASVLRAALRPTELMPLDGIVRETANRVTKAARTDLDKTRAIYDWVVANAHREPKTRGCGTGDIKTMLETGNLGGKCADLNAVFVGLCRASGVPARDLYGLRLGPSAFGYKELGANPANLKSAQHCRAEVYLAGHGWVAMDPADVLKVMRQETAQWIRDPKHPLVAPVNAGLFGGWEGNWVGWNTGHDVSLPGARGKTTLPFLMYPNGENASGRFDELAPDEFRYVITSRELPA